MFNCMNCGKAGACETYRCLIVFVSVRRLGTCRPYCMNCGRAGTFETYGCIIASVFISVRRLGTYEHCMNCGRVCTSPIVYRLAAWNLRAFLREFGGVQRSSPTIPDLFLPVYR